MKKALLAALAAALILAAGAASAAAPLTAQEIIEQTAVPLAAANDTPAGIRYDYTFLEANYDETKLRMLGDSWHGQYNAYVDSSERHLAKDESLRFYARHRKEGGEYIELHKSTRFY